VLTLATLSGPLPKLGIVVLALLAAGALLAPGARRRALAVAGALVLAPVLLLADIWHSPQLSVLHRHPLPSLAATAVALGLLVLAARALADRPALVAPLAVVALPFRIPISAGGATSNLLVPLYLVVGAGALAMVLRGLRTGTEPPDPQRPPFRLLDGLLALVVVLYAVQSVYSPYFEKALQQTVFFYIPFTLLFCLLRELDWDSRLVGRCLRAVVALAIVFALLGFIEYDTKTLLLNPKLIAANDLHAYFTVNSVFFDPDIFGRFLAIVMIALAGLLLRDRARREELGVIGVLAVLWCGLVLTLSRSSLGALLVGLGVLAALRWRVRAILPVVAAVVLAGAIAIVATPKTFGLNTGLNNASSGRASLVTGGLDMFAQRPLWGYGSGSFIRQYRTEHPSASQTLSASHTIPITIAAEQGLIGELPYIALVVAAIALLLSGAREDPIRAGVAAAFIALVFHTMLYADFLEDPVTWTLLGAGAAMARGRRALQPVGVIRSPSTASVASARPAPAAS
jgi:O-antigen ligase